VKVGGDKGGGSAGEALVKYRLGEFEVFPCAGGLILRYYAAFVYAVGYQVSLHGLRLAYIFAVTLAAGYYHRGIWAVLQILKRGVQPELEGEGYPLSAHCAAQHDEHVLAVIRLPVGGRAQHCPHAAEKHHGCRIADYEQHLYKVSRRGAEPGHEEPFKQAYEQQRHAHYCGKGGAEVAVAYGGEPDCVHRHKPAGYYKKVVHICASLKIILKSLLNISLNSA